ncbi:MAG: tetratricopeptide repeat protein [Kiritimatiellaeota bacterium]|nr:tetratricopeptide repeat protein [Kiritimatiellota bacterium]
MTTEANIYQQREKRPAIEDELGAQSASPTGRKKLQQEFVAARRRRLLMRRLAVGLLAVYALAGIGWVAYSINKRGLAAPPAPKETAAAPVAPAPVHLGVAETERWDLYQMRAAIDTWRQAPDKLQQAHDLRLRGHVDSAQQALEQLRKDNPDNLELQLELAQIYLEKNQFRRATDLLLRVLNMDPARESARIALVSAYAQLARHDMALALAQWILESKPDAVLAHRVAAAAYRHQGRAEQELLHLRRWVALEPASAEAACQIAETLTRLRAYDKAQPLWEEIVKKYPDNADAFRLLAVCYAQQAQTEKSVEILVRALSLFGAPRVADWFADKGFDGIRDQKLFSILQKQLNRPAFAVQTNRGAEGRIDMNTLFDAKKASQFQEMLKKDKP